MAIYVDKAYPDIVWLRFEGPTWTEFNKLLNVLQRDWVDEADTPFYLAFQPMIDMPKGSPLPHVKRIIQMVADSPEVVHMIVIVPDGMFIAHHFVNIAARIFPAQMKKVTLVPTKEKLYSLYHKLSGTPSS